MLRNKRKRVAQILYSGCGGHGSVAFSLIHADNNQSWRHRLLFYGIEPVLSAYVASCQRIGIPHKYIQAVSGKPWLSWPGIFRYLVVSQPDAVILHSATALLPCWIYVSFYRKSLIMVEHQPNSLKKKSEWIFTRLAMWLGDAVVLLTPAYKKELKQKIGWFYRGNKVRIIANGIDTEHFSRSDQYPLEKKRTVRLGMAARFTPSKRQDALIETLLQLQNMLPDTDWQLTLAGNGTNREIVRQQARRVGIEEFVDFPGYLDEKELIRWFRSIDLYLHASDGETLSTSLLQAMSMRLPIIASDIPGIRNLLTGNINYGLLVKNSDPDGFTEAVKLLFEHPEQARKIALDARRRSVEVYSHYKMFNLYNNILLEE